MISCGKCSLEIDAVAGYAKCVGCNQRYHFGQCSVSSATWRGKSQLLKDDWRCEACRKLNSQSPSVDNVVVPEVRALGTMPDGTKSILDAIHQLGRQQDEKLNNLKSSLKSYTNGHCVNLEKRIQELSTQLNTVCAEVKGISTTQKQLLEENVKLKKDLANARQYIEELELKTLSSSGVSMSRNSNDGQFQGTCQDKSRVTMSYVRAVTDGSGNASTLTDASGVGVRKSQTSSQSGSHSAQSAVRASPLVQRSDADKSSTPVGGSQSRITGQNDEWTLVPQKRKKNVISAGTKKKTAPKIGTRTVDCAGGSQSQSLPMVKPLKPRERKSALFVSRFAPEVSSQDIGNLIRESVTLSQLKVSKIKTRHNNDYSSFHVEVLHSELSKIDDVNIWPDGCLIKLYYGSLLPDIIIDENVRANVSNVLSNSHDSQF
ncbi:hypothetical protein M8J77_011139 [Diaphorina citri]|nr:hypothetical protein M8J77_011139 [Diaphorina citri]